MKINQTTLKTIRNADVATINEIIREIKERQRSLQQEIATSFRKGQAVQFTARRGEVVKGIVEKVNRKTIVVKTDLVTWKVSPSLLRAA
jgi:hypothetical protein